MARADVAATDDRTPVTVAVLGNDSDPDGDLLTITSVSTPGAGTVVVSGDVLVYTPAINFSGPVTFSYTIDDGRGGTDTATVTVEVTDVTPPTVLEVKLHGTAWTMPAYSIPVGSGEQLKTLPWVNLDQVSIRFSEDVSTAVASLAVRGVRVRTYRILAFSYDPATFPATWTLARTIVSDKVLLNLSDAVTDASGNHLDGEWTNPTGPGVSGGSDFPSGDGTAGGRFRFRFNAITGDVNRSGRVTAADVKYVRALVLLGDYDSLADVNGDGLVNVLDLRQVAARIGLRLPVGEPSFD